MRHADAAWLAHEHTILFDPSVHLRVCKMGDALELCRRAVLAERYQMGDTVARGTLGSVLLTCLAI